MISVLCKNALNMFTLLGTLNSVWDECGRSSMDRTTRPSSKKWVPQRHVTVCDDVISSALMLCFPSYLCPYSFLAETKGFAEKLVAQQEVIP